MREVLSLTYEFVITVILLVGAGFLLYLFRGQASFEAILAMVSAATSSVLTFWFQRRQADRLINNRDQGKAPDPEVPPGGASDGQSN